MEIKNRGKTCPVTKHLPEFFRNVVRNPSSAKPHTARCRGPISQCIFIIVASSTTANISEPISTALVSDGNLIVEPSDEQAVPRHEVF